MSLGITTTTDLQPDVTGLQLALTRLSPYAVNNAGWHPPHRSIDDFSVDQLQDLMQINFVSAFALCKFALPYLRTVNGNIINMSSWVGAFGQSKATTCAHTTPQTSSVLLALPTPRAAALACILLPSSLDHRHPRCGHQGGYHRLHQGARD